MIYGLGHSTFDKEDFVDICRAANISTIIDTRSHPGSKNYPHFNKSSIQIWLPSSGINYEWWPELGGWLDKHAHLGNKFRAFDVDIDAYKDAFPKQRIAKSRLIEEGSFGFTNYGFHDYQFFMTLEEFHNGIEKLILREDNVACICCESYWARCHRSMIADYLVYVKHKDMIHITPRFRKIKKPRTVVSLKSHSEVIGDRIRRYHDYVITNWVEHKVKVKPLAQRNLK